MIAANDSDAIVAIATEAPGPIDIGTAAAVDSPQVTGPAGFGNVSGRMLGRPAPTNPAG